MWFEFLKMAHNEPDLVQNLQRSKDYYEPWGDVTSLKFDDWWSGHKHLFGETTVRQVSSVSNSSNAINLAIPLNLPVSKVLAEVKRLVEESQTQRLVQKGIDPKLLKSLHSGFGTYELTTGVEVRGRTLYEIQLMYQYWQELAKPPVNTNTISEIVNRFRGRPRAKWVPYILQMKPLPDKKGNLRYDEGQIRQVRRYLKKGYEVCKSASVGEFPGRNTL
jgi:hypothetical protein